MSDSIGGYFEYELLSGSLNKKSSVYSSGRSALAALLKYNNIEKLYVSYYTCDAVLEPLDSLGISYEFYNIDKRLLPLVNFNMQANSAMLVNNYFGLLDNEIRKNVTLDYVIIDNCQALYSELIGGLGAFNSYRKFVGVTDGGQAKILGTQLYSNDERYNSILSFGFLFGRIEIGPEAYYKDYQEAEKLHRFTYQKTISKFSEMTFSSINHDKVRAKRRKNYKFIAEKLDWSNRLNFDLEEEVPLCYPYLPRYDGGMLIEYLRSHNIYIPKYWPNDKIISPIGSWEHHLKNNLVCLPIDQRYGFKDMRRLIDLILQYEKRITK